MEEVDVYVLTSKQHQLGDNKDSSSQGSRSEWMEPWKTWCPTRFRLALDEMGQRAGLPSSYGNPAQAGEALAFFRLLPLPSFVLGL